MTAVFRSAMLCIGVLTVAVPACSSSDGSTVATTTPPPITATVAASPACSTGGSITLDQLAISVAGTLRSARVFIPPGAEPTVPLPVVLSFHGVGEKAGDRADLEGFPTSGVEHDFISVYPVGLVGDAGVSGLTGWDVTGTIVDEPAFVAALLDALGDQVCIDPARVYASGFSNGGGMAMLLACELSDRIAAVAAVAGAFRTAGCDGHPAPVPIIVFHGLDDVLVPYAGSATVTGFPAVPDVMAAHAAINGCTGQPAVETVAAGVDRQTWTGCTASVILYTLDDHGHAWPGRALPIDADDLARYIAPQIIPDGESALTVARSMARTNLSVDATELIWTFFNSIDA